MTAGKCVSRISARTPRDRLSAAPGPGDVENLRRRGLRPDPRGRDPRSRRRRLDRPAPHRQGGRSERRPRPLLRGVPGARRQGLRPAPLARRRAGDRADPRAGGVAVIAHPYWDISEPDEVEDLIRSLGADGVETFYPSHSKEHRPPAGAMRGARLSLVPTGSSDYHGPTHKTFARFGAYDTYGLGEPRCRRSRRARGQRRVFFRVSVFARVSGLPAGRREGRLRLTFALPVLASLSLALPVSLIRSFYAARPRCGGGGRMESLSFEPRRCPAPEL